MSSTTTTRSAQGGRGESNMAGLFEGLIEALADKHSQLDINFQNVGLRMPGMQRLGVELNGTVTVSVHMRDLTDEEKQALASKNPALISK